LSRANAATLVDTHWVGGDPQRLQPYGWASWSPRKGILTLRNPGNVVQSIVIDVEQAFELPPSAPRHYSAKSPWIQDRRMAPISFHAGEERKLRLEPYEVMTLEMVAR